MRYVSCERDLRGQACSYEDRSPDASIGRTATRKQALRRNLVRQDSLTTTVANGRQPSLEHQASGNGLPTRARTAPPPEPPTTPTLEIANAIVHTYKELLGRGPTKARVLFTGADVLLVVLEDTMTVQERTLASLGEHERVREHRLFLTVAAENQFRTIVEAALGRRTLARVTGFDIHCDVAAEIFTLEPEDAQNSEARASQPS